MERIAMMPVRARGLAHAFAMTAALLCGSDVFTEGRVGRAEDYPNPYRIVEIRSPCQRGGSSGGSLGSPSITTGKDIWVLDTCGGDLNGCVTSDVDPVMRFDASGTFVTSFGGGIIFHPHALYVDPSGNVWVADGYGGPDPIEPKGGGQQVLKFSPDGEVLLTLGTAGVRGQTDSTFNTPSDVVVAPNGTSSSPMVMCSTRAIR